MKMRREDEKKIGKPRVDGKEKEECEREETQDCHRRDGKEEKTRKNSNTPGDW